MRPEYQMSHHDTYAYGFPGVGALTSKYGDYYRVGNDAVQIDCLDSGQSCDVANSVRNVFVVQ
jgi:hypothetical protein